MTTGRYGSRASRYELSIIHCYARGVKLPPEPRLTSDRSRVARPAEWEERASYDATPTRADRRLFFVSLASVALAILIVVALWLAR